MNLTLIQGVVQRRTTIIQKVAKEKVGVVGAILNSRRDSRNDKKRAEESRLLDIKLERMRLECERSGKWILDGFFFDVEVDINKEVFLGPKPEEDRRIFLSEIKKLPHLADRHKAIHLPVLAKIFGDKEEKKNFPFTIRFMALGACYGEWYLETPNQMGFYGKEAESLALSGLIVISPPRTSNLTLFYSPSLRPR